MSERVAGNRHRDSNSTQTGRVLLSLELALSFFLNFIARVTMATNNVATATPMATLSFVVRPPESPIPADADGVGDPVVDDGEGVEAHMPDDEERVVVVIRSALTVERLAVFELVEVTGVA